VTVEIGYMPTGGSDIIGLGRRRDEIRLADEAGLDHLAFGDHVSFYVGAGSDGLLGAAMALGASGRLRANTGVYLLPLRHPVVVARQVADLASLAPGRFTFGVGIGGEDPHEVEVCGVDPKTRGRRMDECMAVVRSLLAGDRVDLDGEFFQLSDARIVPVPEEPVPIVVGGRSDAALRRAGRLGDGWLGVWVSPRRYGEAVGEVAAHAAAAGRDDHPAVHGLNVWCGVGADRDRARAVVARKMETVYQLPYERFEKWSPAGTPADLAEFVVPYVEAGCRFVNLIACGDSLEDEVHGVAEVRRLVLKEVGS